MSQDIEASQETGASAPAVEPLTATEARVLGCLVEKQATTPETYPLTLNAVVLACNQIGRASCRERV